MRSNGTWTPGLTLASRLSLTPHPSGQWSSRPPPPEQSEGQWQAGPKGSVGPGSPSGLGVKRAHPGLGPGQRPPGPRVCAQAGAVQAVGGARMPQPTPHLVSPGCTRSSEMSAVSLAVSPRNRGGGEFRRTGVQGLRKAWPGHLNWRRPPAAPLPSSVAHGTHFRMPTPGKTLQPKPGSLRSGGRGRERGGAWAEGRGPVTTLRALQPGSGLRGRVLPWRSAAPWCRGAGVHLWPHLGASRCCACSWKATLTQ